MKTGRLRSFWPLSPTTAAQRLERSCWLAAAGLALALVLAPLPTPSRAGQAIMPTAGAPAPHWTIYQQHCIERILARSANKTEEGVASRISQLCITPFLRKPAAANLTPLSCEQAFSPRPALVGKPVAGCLGG